MRQVLILSLLCMTSFTSWTQKKDDNLKEYFLDAEFFLAEEQYVDALYDYMELYNAGYQDNANINYRIGICYLNIPGQKEKSIPYLLESIKNIKNNNRESEFREAKAPMDAYLYLGNAYRVNNMLDKAIEAYNKYKELLPASDNAGLSFVDHEIEACNAAMEFINNPVEIRKTNIGEPVNSNSSNFNPVLSGDGKTILYMNELPFYDAVYYSVLENGKWTEPVNITPQIQSDGDQYVTSVSHNGDVIYLSRDDNFNSDIYYSYLKDGIWQKSEPLSKKINTKYWESHASISRDGKTLYLASNRKDGFGGSDIYKSELSKSGEWSEPENLGSVINTPLNEDTPFITEDGNQLYFSSQGHRNMGGYDIFKSTKDANGQWGPPENLGYPVNTTDNDLFYYPVDNGNTAYLSVFDPTGFGKEDIYQIKIITPELLEKEIAERVKKDVEEEEMTQQLEAKPDEKTEEIVEQEAEAIEETKEPAELSEQMIAEEKAEEAVAEEKTEDTIPEEEIEEAVTEEETEEAVAEEETEEAVAEEKADITDVAEKSDEEKATAITAAEELREVIITPVYFGFDRYDLTAESKARLDKIALLAREFKNLDFELIGLTDAIGPASYNKLLSERRAQSVKTYLLSAGINAGRLVAIGYGETRFAAINSNPDGTDNPEGRKYNRRVEIEIKGEDLKKIIIKRFEVPDYLKIK
jgi:outer membrane protein OmpA-like peptidoglycan-associated protein